MNWDKYTGMKSSTIRLRSAEEIVREKEDAHLQQMIGSGKRIKRKVETKSDEIRQKIQEKEYNGEWLPSIFSSLRNPNKTINHETDEEFRKRIADYLGCYPSQWEWLETTSGKRLDNLAQNHFGLERILHPAVRADPNDRPATYPSSSSMFKRGLSIWKDL